MQKNILKLIEKENLVNNTNFVKALYVNALEKSPKKQPDDLQKLENIAMQAMIEKQNIELKKQPYN